MSMEFGDLAAQIAGEVRITPLEIADLRGVGWADGQMTPDQAEFLFVANETGGDAGPEWCDFFVEALTSYVVHTVLPRGYVDAEMAELELLVRVIEVASSVPEVLRTYALQQFEEAVAMGDGPTRHGELDRCGINQTEVKLLRRLIFGTGSERPGGVGKAEAELLFRIKDATLYEVNCLEWQDFFVKGVAQFLLGFAGEETPSPQRMRELESFMAREGAGLGSFLSRMARSEGETGFASLLELGGGAEALDDWDDRAEMAALLTGSEQGWLKDMLEADEDLDDLERALIAFIDAETGETFVPRP